MGDATGTLVLIVLIGLVALAAARGGSTGAQLGDDPTVTAQNEGTIAVLQTQMAELEETVSARRLKINAQRTQIAGLRGTEPAPVDAEPTKAAGSGS
jgi:hypothetical protein